MPLALRSFRPAALGLLAVAALGCVQAASPIVEPREFPAWTRVRGSQFSITTDLGPDPALRFAEDLETFTALVRRVTGRRALPARPLEIVVFAKPRDHERYRTHASQDALFISDGDRSFALVGDAPRWFLTRQRLFHEYTHYLMSESARAAPYPLWYAEGLAEFLSTSHWSAGSAAIGLLPARVPGDIALGRWLPLASVLSLRDVSELAPEDRSLFYSEAWATIHYLHTVGMSGGSERLPELYVYLRAVRSGVPWRRAARRSFRGGVPALDAELRAYWRALPERVGFLSFDPSELEIAEPEAPHALSEVEVTGFFAELDTLIERVQGKPPAPHAP
jgi:hypothetical protein